MRHDKLGTMPTVLKVQLPLEGLDDLIGEASAEGFTFLERLEEDWADGTNRFSGDGEAFYAVFAQEQLVAVGGLSCDPFLGEPGTGRLRRIYVRAPWRRRGVGAALVGAMLADARQHFRTVRLRADNAAAARLYEKFGFQTVAHASATHVLHFEL
jgi:GNAT superfamily N-acetyltransferase